jgi:hypothetical protein
MALDVELIGEEDIKVKGGIEKKRKGYKKYSDAVDRINLAAWIKEEIEKKPERMIVVKIDDVAKEMGPEFKKTGYQIMYQALKAILFQQGIFLGLATHKDGDKTFVLRYVKEGDRLAPSYLFVKHRIKQEEMLEIEEQETDEKKEKETKEGQAKSRRARIIKEKLVIQEEEKEKERQEIIAVREEIRKLKEILYGRLGKKSCMMEIFQFNWNTLTWRMIKRSSVRSYIKLLDVVMDNTSTTENRYRIEFTPLYQLENMEKELLEDEDSGEYKADNTKGQAKDGVKNGVKGEHGIEAADLAEVSDTLEELISKEEKIGKVGDVEGVEKVEQVVEQVQEKKEGELECPRCGGKNIKTWSTVQVIKTRSGDRKLRHRCEDCNETFSDEDLGI